jgi:hypothetical protein
MQNFIEELCSCHTSKTPTHSRSRSRSSGRHPNGRGRSRQSPRHRHEARQPHGMRYDRSSGSRRRSGHRDSRHSPTPNNYDVLSRRVQTDPVSSNRSAHNQTEHQPTRRSTLPPHPARAEVRSSRPTQTSRSGFEPLANPAAYQEVNEGVHLRDDHRVPRTSTTSRKSTHGVSKPVPVSRLDGRNDTVRVADIRTAATARAFDEMLPEFWKTQLSGAERSVALKVLKTDLGEVYPSEIYPVLSSKPGSSFCMLPRHCASAECHQES